MKRRDQAEVAPAPAPAQPTTTPMWGLAAANAVSICGTRLSQIAVPWFVLTTTGSSLQTGLVTFVQLVPLVLVQVLGGPFVDRAGARRIAIAADVASVLAVAAIPALNLVGLLTFPTLLVLVALTGLTRGPADVGHHALIPAVVKVTGQPMERVTGLIGTADRLAALAGAGAGGAIIAAVGAVNALALNAVSFLLSAIILGATTKTLTTRPRHVPAQPSHQADEPTDAAPPRSRYLHELREGLDFLRRDKLLLGIVLAVAVTNMLDQGYSAVLLTGWADQTGHGTPAIGLLGACFGGAALTGSLLATRLGPRLPRLPIYLVGFLGAAAPRWIALALDAPLPAITTITLLSGLGAGFLNPILGAVQFERIPDHLMGRVSATSLATAWMLMPFGGLLAAGITDCTDLTTALFSFSLLYLAVITLPALHPGWRTTNTHH